LFGVGHVASLLHPDRSAGHHAGVAADASDDEIAERLKRQTRARLKEKRKESRQLLDAAKQQLRKT
jgi:hypothetical protein